MIRCDLGETITDHRGVIQDLLVEPFDSVTLVRTKKDAVRGNHYHRHTFQWSYILSGSLLVASQDPAQPHHDTAILAPGDLVLWPPMDAHAWKALEDTEVMVFTRGPRSGPGYESDTYRLEEPLIDA